MKKKNIIRIALLLLVLAGIAAAFYYRQILDIEQAKAWIQGLGWIGPVVFIFFYILATVLFFPGSVVTAAGGAVFGPVWGTLINLLGATAGATLAFLVARYLAADWVSKKVGGRMKALVDGVESEGWRFVAFVRLVPLFPFNLLNYALGLTRIRLTTYILTSFVCMAPGSFAYTYIGYVGVEALSGGEDLIKKILYAVAAFATAAFVLPILVRRMHKKVQNEEKSSEANPPQT